MSVWQANKRCPVCGGCDDCDFCDLAERWEHASKVPGSKTLHGSFTAIGKPPRRDSFPGDWSGSREDATTVCKSME